MRLVKLDVDRANDAGGAAPRGSHTAAESVLTDGRTVIEPKTGDEPVEELLEDGRGSWGFVNSECRRALKL